MTLEENKEIVRRFNEEAFVQGDATAADRYLARDVYNHVTGARGVEDWKRLIRDLHALAPDSEVTVEDLIAEDDKVVIYVTWSGTHHGETSMPWGKIPATGKPFSVRHVHLYRLADGKITEHWAVRDDLGMLLQIGALPRPSE